MVYKRLKRGWDVEDALTMKPFKNGVNYGN